MVSFIILGKDTDEGIAYIYHQCDILHISSFDRIVLSKETSEKATTHINPGQIRDKSLGISEIKTLQKKIYLKPLQGSDKAIIIMDAALLTIEAQNALLKVLEEPPNHTYIYILAGSLQTFLPTIVSRCKVVHVHSVKDPARDAIGNMTNLLLELPAMTVGKKLRIAELQGKQRQTAVEWLENILSITRTLLIVSVRENKGVQIEFYLRFVKQVQQAHAAIQSTNVNIRLALEHLLLNM